jgi:alkylated DNA repair dioxygenase AlkB
VSNVRISAARGRAPGGPIEILDGDLLYLPGFVPRKEADRLLGDLLALPDWQRLRLRIFGRELDAPRLTAWYGDAGARYGYSGVVHEPRPWPAPLTGLRARLQGELQLEFNSVLANRYRDGRDSMGWHSDDEPELGPAPVVASISVGAQRRFRLRHRIRKDVAPVSVLLEHGSLLVMGGETQRCWAHSLPRSAACRTERVNLTFRRVVI